MMDESCRTLTPVSSKTHAYQDNIKKVYDRYMNGFPKPITISGGVVRDIILNNTIRDYDIYINECDFNDYLRFLLKNNKDSSYSIKEDTYYDEAKATNDEKEMYFHLPMKRRVLLELNGCLLDIICMKNNFEVTALSIANLHTVGISQCGIKKDGSVYTSELFQRDIKDKMITMSRVDWGHAKSMKYFIKLWDKYQWPLRIGIKQDDSFCTTLSHPITLGGSGGTGAPVPAVPGLSFKGYAFPTTFTGISAT